MVPLTLCGNLHVTVACNVLTNTVAMHNFAVILGHNFAMILWPFKLGNIIGGVLKYSSMEVDEFIHN